MKEKIEIEYHLNCSVALLFRLITTEAGLSAWFADKVVEEPENIYHFYWGKMGSLAQVRDKADNSFIRFQWEEDLNGEPYFEFRITASEISNDVALIVTDFCEADEKEDTMLYWQNNIRKLRLICGG